MQVQYIPEEIIMEFLFSLPIKPLIKFQSVCKSWHDLINHRHFVKTDHVNRGNSMETRAASKLAVVVSQSQRDVDGIYIVKRDFGSLVPRFSTLLVHQPFYDYKILQCYPQACRGLVCFSAFAPRDSQNITLVVTNPVIREFRELPPPPQTSKHRSLGLPYIVSSSDPSSDNSLIKVLWPFLERSENRDVSNGIYVINLVNDVSWRKLFSIETDRCLVFPSLNHGVPFRFPDTKVHVGPRRTYDQEKILVFDAMNENFLRINFVRGEGYIRIAFVFRRSLFVLSSQRSKPERFDVWEMKDYNKVYKWKKVISCDLRSLYDHTPGGSIRFVVHAVIEDGIVMKLFPLNNINSLIDVIYAFYDPVKKVLQRYHMDDDLFRVSLLEGTEVIWGDYVESLVSPNRGY